MRFRHALPAFALFTSLAAHAQQAPEPSLKYTIVTFYGDMITGHVAHCQTVYLLGRNTRTEWGPAHAVILNRDRRQRFVLDLKAKVYTAMELDDHGLPVNAQPDPTIWKCSGRIHTIRIETVDTGERRLLFGYPARHVKRRCTDTISPPRDISQTTSESDGWFIAPAAWLRLTPRGNAGSVVYGGGQSDGYVGEMDEIRITREGPQETGLPVILKSGRTYNRVIGLSEEPLDPGLFQPPPDFKRVTELPAVQFSDPYPWSMDVKLRWLMLTDWL